MWQDGRRAWVRLNGWHQDEPGAVPGHRDDGRAALSALADLGLVRRLIDRAELVAVRTALGNGVGWSEIATALGTDQDTVRSRWRDLDGQRSSDPVDP